MTIVRHHFEVEQTAVTVLAGSGYIKIAKDAIFDARSQIISKISADPFFGTTYEPYTPSPNDECVVKRMCIASLAASVGPMAAVAGAIAEYAVERMVSAGAEYAVVDNGGDIALVSDRIVNIGMYVNVNGKGLSLKIMPTARILGICSSSASVGPSVSFGGSDISTVISNDVSLADACATALGNAVNADNIKEPLEHTCGIDGVIGCLSYCNGMLSVCGDVPEMVTCETDDLVITKMLFPK